MEKFDKILTASALIHLILVPTEAERTPIESALRADPTIWKFETIGCGVIAAGAGAAAAIARHEPATVILVGIAGLFVDRENSVRTLGKAATFRTVAVDGIGSGLGEHFVDDWRLGWPWAGPQTFDLVGADATCDQLLTVCSTSACESDASWRRHRFPDAVGEDMEGYAVAHACYQEDLPLTIVRGFSNFVGRRDKDEWKIEAAIADATKLLQMMVETETR